MYEKFFSIHKTNGKNYNLQILVELKNGDTFNGNLLKMDSFMNLFLEKVIITTKTGSLFYESTFVYIKGENVKYIRFPWKKFIFSNLENCILQIKDKDRISMSYVRL